ncbi:Aste57867_22278 [Aphanomyces stellatus]|uniref:Aste57867_1799 protein n=1 Tax=Aphanomyces stellatus TaxID=120398 RepID=A0A485K9K0_9STRA|nr:hypothetical protein As57867_022208 [Aphanomyces stellatus]KAF0713054.1 hypothetical protein As57867_004530 [Aphanomyces stellatus]KAF0718260.1 hypothetical protein As57867_001797 [Aphanomyces stellatus]VFT79008.1 Aste57867_1799 [Aphanomyces stellatus]VFT81650.1 Aste57867_4543 [Aphanomyces stellatus]
MSSMSLADPAHAGIRCALLVATQSPSAVGHTFPLDAGHAVAAVDGAEFLGPVGCCMTKAEAVDADVAAAVGVLALQLAAVADAATASVDLVAAGGHRALVAIFVELAFV